VVERGQLIGMIKFGSRADILLPADAELKVAKGTRVKGGATILAVVPAVAEMQANLSRAVGA
jgi:phosphatidylserine decarboxylase